MIKHNKWIGKIHREGILSKSRYEKLCLDKNERVTNFSKSFFNQFVSKINSKRIIAYPEVWKLYYALANLHRIKTNQLFLTAGIDGAIKNCFELFVAKRGKVITLNPTFAMVDIYCKIFNAKRFNINYNGKLKLNVNYLIQSIDRKTSLVIIANPNSPTGTIIDKIDLEKIIKKANSLNVPVLIDEAYHEFCNMTVLPLVKKYKNLIIARTFSKAYGLAGLRVGYLISNKKISKLLFNLKPMYEVNSIAILASTMMIKKSKIHKNYISEIKKGFKFITKFLASRKINFISTHANFIYINVGNKINYFYKKLFKYGILTRKGLSVRGYKNYLRITLGPEKEMKRVIQKLIKLKAI